MVYRIIIRTCILQSHHSMHIDLYSPTRHAFLYMVVTDPFMRNCTIDIAATALEIMLIDINAGIRKTAGVRRNIRRG